MIIKAASRIFFTLILCVFAAKTAFGAETTAELVTKMTDANVSWELRVAAEDALAEFPPQEALPALLQHIGKGMPTHFGIWNSDGEHDKNGPVDWQIYYAVGRSWMHQVNLLPKDTGGRFLLTLLNAADTETAQMQIIHDLGGRLWVPEAEAPIAEILSSSSAGFKLRMSAASILTDHGKDDYHEIILSIAQASELKEQTCWFDILYTPRHKQQSGIDPRVVKLGFELILKEKEASHDYLAGAAFLAVKTGEYLGKNFAPDQLKNSLEWWDANKERIEKEIQQMRKVGPATPVADCEISEALELGEWEDIFVPDTKDFIVLRRGDTIFSLEMKPGAEPVKLASEPRLKRTEIKDAIPSGDRLWLLLSSIEQVPFAFDAKSGLLREFEVPGFEFFWEKPSCLHNHIFIPELDGLIVQAVWDRSWIFKLKGTFSYNCFFLNLKTGELTQFPKDWRLDYFTKDVKTGIFRKMDSSDMDYERMYAAADLSTGKILDSVPDIDKELYAELERDHPIMPVYSNGRSKRQLKGLSLNGIFIPLEENITIYRNEATARDGFLAFRECKNNGENYPLWIVPFKGGKAEKLLGPQYGPLQLLGRGNCIFVKVSPKDIRTGNPWAEAFFRERGGGSIWNLLAGLKALPEFGLTSHCRQRLEQYHRATKTITHKNETPLPYQARASELFPWPDTTSKSEAMTISDVLSLQGRRTNDAMSVELNGSFGSEESDSLALYHFRRDGVLPPVELAGCTSVLWHAWMLVDSQGRRSWVKFPQKLEQSAKKFIHNSGLLLVQKITYHDGEEEPCEKHFKLSVLQLTPQGR